METTIDNEKLTAIFQDACEGTQFNEVETNFTAFRDLKLKWCRSYNWIHFDVSDYLATAPEEVILSIAEVVMSRIAGNRVDYPEEVAEWLTSEDFVATNQPTYIHRCRGLKGPQGEFHDLNESYQRLLDRELIFEDRDIYLGWGPATTGRRTGFSSVLMKVVNMDGCLDNENIPEDALDYALYAQLAHISMGFDPSTTRRTEEYEELLNAYPEREEMEAKLKMYGIRL